MARYINADAFDERVRVAGGFAEEDLTDDFKEGILTVLKMLKTQPTADVREVVHGQWIRYGTVLKCSACRNKIPTPMTRAYPFCPNCGADMRGE